MSQKLYRSILIKIVPIFLLIGLGSSGAQVGFLPISADYAVFQNSDSASYVEIYMSFYQGSLNYKNVNDTLSAIFRTNLTIMAGKKIIRNITHKFSNHVADTSKFNRLNQFYDIFKLGLKPGKYRAIARLQDRNSGMTGEYVMDIKIKDAPKTMYLSDVQLATSISKTDSSGGRYSKNGLNIIPNARKSCDMLTPMLYYYVEINNLLHSSATEYQFYYSIKSEDGRMIKKGPVLTKAIIANSQAEASGFNALSLPEGRYTLLLNARLSDDDPLISSRKPFLVYKPNRKKTNNSLSGGMRDKVNSEFLTMSGENIKRELNIARYLATPEEANAMKGLDSTQALRIFITQFWQNQDKKHDAVPGASRRHFLEMVNQANQSYHHLGKPGWKSDRGRVLIVYGPPDEVDRNTNNMETKPYIVWRYNQLYGGVEFVFADRNGFGTYELIHSSYYKEIQNPDWQREITKSSFR